ncbi:MAG: 30S ribosomal protein S6 [Eubacteriales bacterium]|nr:30S ribosomal protein S6 [Eubacteriales bacterium]
MKYELIYIIDAAVNEEERKQLIARYNELIEQNGGKVEKVDEWGKRRLAYEINDKTEGYYVLLNYTAAPEVPKEIERNLAISEDILRYLTVRVEEKTSRVKPKVSQPRPYYKESAPRKADEQSIDKEEQEAVPEVDNNSENE